MLLTLLLACKPEGSTPIDSDPQVAQRPSGDAAKGWDVLRYGDFVGSGVPAELWFELIGQSRGNYLDREGDSAKLSPAYNLFTSPEGVEVVGGVACFGCHAGYLNGDFVPGLGNVFVDYSESTTGFYDLALLMVESRYGEDSAEATATARFVRGASAAAPYIVTPFAGVSPAFSIERAVVTWRDPETLEWLDSPLYEVPETVPASDTPPWWNVKKKAQLYYNGMGQGDYARLIEQTGVVAIIDRAHAEDIDQDFADVLAWILALEPPVYPEAIDSALAAQGQPLFEASCSACHGTYGETETYPGLRVPVEEVGTDPVYAQELAYEPFNDWLKASWYGQEPYAAAFDASLAYVAPPLDGIWASAPYLHNGSVPDLAALLDSSQRPVMWSRSYSSSAYDFVRVGFPWEEQTEVSDSYTYNTTVAGFSAQGHAYGDVFSAEERAAVLEYLKTL